MKTPLLTTTTTSNFDIDSALKSLGNPFQYTDIGTFMSNLIEFLMILGGITALLFLVWGGFEWITSAGDKQGTEKARSRISDSIIGLIVLFSAWTIFQVLQVFLGVDVAEKTLVSQEAEEAATTKTGGKSSCVLATQEYNWVLAKNSSCIKNEGIDWNGCWRTHITKFPCDNFYIKGDETWWKQHPECSKPGPLCP
jgi:hypothetical protein